MKSTIDQKTFEHLSTRDRSSGTDPLGGFAYDLDLTVPHITTAIHAGHQVRDELLPLMSLPEKDRLAEEDAATDQIIRDCPSTIWGLDSRAEYDINRPPDKAIPLTSEMFWGTRVYGSSPTEAMIRRSLEKYEAFYRFVATVIKILLDRFNACVVYDIHSYNIQRQMDKGHPAPPLFNLGTRGIDREKWKAPISSWLAHLKRIKIPDQATVVAENAVFGGMGEFCHRLNTWDANILVLPTEISKVYMNELTGIINDATVHALQGELSRAVATHGSTFQQSYCR